jgi:RNA polymerase sigma-70 factor, ECF subfamily
LVQGLFDQRSSDGSSDAGLGSSVATSDAGGSPPTFEALYQQHFAYIWRALRCLGVPASAIDDAAQEVWVVVHRRLSEFEGRSQLKTWLFGIALNVNRNRRRSLRRRPPEHELPPEVASSTHDPALEQEGREAWQLVSEYLSTLDEPRREVFVCCLLQGLSAPEAAELTGLPLATVYDRVRALRRSFKGWLERSAKKEVHT